MNVLVVYKHGRMINWPQGGTFQFFWLKTETVQIFSDKFQICIIGLIQRRVASPLSQYRSLVYMVYGVLAVWTSMGWTYVTLTLSHCILLYSISLVKIRWLCLRHWSLYPRHVQV